MRIYKTKTFARQAKNCGLSNKDLIEAAKEICDGLLDANLGGYLIKKRLGIAGRGKRGGLRTIVAFKDPFNKIFYLFLFSKNAKEDVTTKELNALKLLASVFLSYSDEDIARAIKANELLEVKVNEKNCR